MTAEDVKTSRKPVTLRAGAIGIVAAATLGIVFMGPAPSFYGSFGPITVNSGGATAFLYLLGGVIVLPTAISYAVCSSRLPAAGSGYTWLGRLLNKNVGVWLGFMCLPYYILVISGPSIVFGLFFNIFLHDIGLNVGLTNFGTFTLGVLICFALATWLAAIGITASTRTLTIVVTFECLVILALALTILVGPAVHLSAAPLNPANGHINYSGFWIVLPIAFAAYTGFDVISTASEETRLPRRSVPVATIVSVIIYGLFMAFVAYCFIFAAPFRQLVAYTNSGITPVGPIATQYWGKGDVLVAITGMTSGMGATLAIIIGTSRIMFAMGRDKALPAAFGRLNEIYRSPWTAIGLVTAIGVIFDLVVGRWIGELNAYFWGGTAITWFALTLYIFVNVGFFILILRNRDRLNLAWMIVPILGVIFSIAVLYKSFIQSLWNAGWVTIGRGIVVFALAWTVLCFILAYLVRKRAVTPRIEYDLVGPDPDASVGSPGAGQPATDT
jgi:APA family basic amino acid/polyamine antiporter